MLVSLFYVASTLLEFAVILLIKRNLGKSIAKRNFYRKRPIVIAATGNTETDDKFTDRGMWQLSSGDSLVVDPTAKIDKTTCILFLFSYFIFNFVYVLIYIDRK